MIKDMKDELLYYKSVHYLEAKITDQSFLGESPNVTGELSQPSFNKA